MQITETITIMTVMISFAAGIVLIFKTLSDNATRRKAIEAGASEEMLKELFKSNAWFAKYDSLKWGMLVASVGIAFMAIAMFGIDFESAMAPGFLFLLPGLALIAYHVISKKSD
jgi:Domain of unknown function (DUF6249)